MKKQLILLAVLALSFFSLNTAFAQVRFGIKAGLNLANISYSDDYIEASEAGISGNIATCWRPGRIWFWQRTRIKSGFATQCKRG